MPFVVRTGADNSSRRFTRPMTPYWWSIITSAASLAENLDFV
jgi:hypothetical protein